MYNNDKIEIKTDCIMYRPLKKECDGLKELYCVKEKCNFYKTKKEDDK